ncbi:MAG: glycosyltransferase family 9 protein [Gemmataceae bacterium]
MSALPPLGAITPRRIALIKPSALGDIVHTLPVLSALRRRFPEAFLAWVVNRAYEPLIAGHPDLDATLPFDRGAVRARGGCRRHGRDSPSIAPWAGQFDLVLDLQGLLRSGLMTWATGAARRVGLAGAREGSRLFYTDVIADPGRGGLHAVDRYWRVAEALGAGDGPKESRLPVDPTAAEWAETMLHPWPRPWLMVSVGSRWYTKRWPPAHFADVLTRATADFGGTAVFLGGSDETALAAAVRGRLTSPSLDLTGRTSLPQLAAVLARADVMLANDTGPLHLAVALGRPVVAPYTCTKAALTGPYGQRQHVVETQVRCGGSYRKRCARLECMTELAPARLWPVLREVLQGWYCQSRRVS